MKRWLYILFLVLLALPLHAQSEKHYTERLDSIITCINKAGEVKSVFTYDKTGLLIEKIEYRDKKEGKWINPEQTLYTYDGNGRIVSLTSKPMAQACRENGFVRGVNMILPEISSL